ncbi:hypothetical protein FF100_31660 [Methylobacterium terricola]|uniref:Uncharacterized protein n=1 Tax=Methylobacterium terricola TaxID=2583531 RepID=A0A5C4L9R3_9HYPH|nr:hypothetical protein [Methylobacterium terricola]TNC07640.1 hypothetical protein FF100_31660 [Methylobacterium terricola]
MTNLVRFPTPNRFLSPQIPDWEITPPPGWNSTSKLPEITDLASFVEVHRYADWRIKNYVAYPQENYVVRAHRDVVRGLQRGAAAELLANNALARIGFAEIAVEHLKAHGGIDRGPVCFVTLAPKQYAFPIPQSRYRFPPLETEPRRSSKAANFDIRKLQAFARQAMGEIPFLGIVEVAFFRNWGPEGQSRYDWASWHTHLLSWGATHAEVSRTLSPVRAKHQSLIKGSPAAHALKLSHDDKNSIERSIFYKMKAPQKQYRVVYYNKEWKNKKGDVLKPGWHLRKDWLRTGQRVQLLDIVGERTLDQLLFGNLEGTKLARAISDEALSTYHDYERRQPWARR